MAEKTLGPYSEQHGYGTIANGATQVVLGRFNNYSDEYKDCLLVIGNGTDDNNRSNAMWLERNGTLHAAGGVVTPETKVRISYVTFTYNEVSDTYNADKPYENIVATAYSDSTVVLGRVYDDNHNIKEMSYFLNNTFITTVVEDNTICYVTYRFDENVAVWVREVSGKPLTAADYATDEDIIDILGEYASHDSPISPVYYATDEEVQRILNS